MIGGYTIERLRDGIRAAMNAQGLVLPIQYALLSETGAALLGEAHAGAGADGEIELRIRISDPHLDLPVHGLLIDCRGERARILWYPVTPEEDALIQAQPSLEVAH